MTGLVRKATLLSAGGLLIAGAAMAGLPNQANCTLPAFYSLFNDGTNLALNLGVPGPSSQLLVIRDESNNVVPNCEVVFDFDAAVVGADGRLGVQANCPAGISICNAQLNPWIGSGTATAGPGKKVTVNCNGLGQLFTTVLGTGPDVIVPASRPNCVKIIAGGVNMGFFTLTSVNYNLNSGGNPGEINFADVSSWLNPSYDGGSGTGTYHSWKDYSGDGVVTLFDLSLLLDAVLPPVNTTDPCTPL